MSTALAQYTESNKNMIELVIANNDEMALGAVSALQTAGYNKDGKRLFLYSVLMQQTQLNQLSSQAQ